MSRQVAAKGGFQLQQCDDCGEVIYPPREMCAGCLSENVHWQPHVGEGEVLVASQLGHSFDDAYADGAYPEILSVKLDDGPTIIVFAGDAGIGAGARVTLDVEDRSPSGPAIVAHKTGSGK